MSTAVDKSQEQQYFKKLLKRPQTKINKVENYLKLAETGYEQKIKSGSFHVKETSDKIQIKKNDSVTKTEAENMRHMKKSLEKSLKLIDSRIQQLTQPDKKSLSMKDEERLKFVSQMAKARKQLDKKREIKLKQQVERDKQQQERQQEEQRKKQQQAKQKKKDQIMKRAQSLQVVRKNKKLEAEVQKKELKSKLQQKILSQRMIEKFKQQQDNVLEERKKKLAEIREIHKPLSKSEFQLHLEKIEKLKNERSRVVDKEDITKYINDPNKFYKSRWYEKTKKEQKAYEDQKHEEQLEQLKQMKDKLKKYSQYVRQNFKPEIDIKKAKQLKEKNKSIVQGPKTEDLRQLGLKYLQYSKEHIDPSKRSSQNEQEQNEASRKNIKPKNYLEQIKKNSKGAKKPQQYVEDLKKKKNLPEAEKAQKILEFIEGLERKAKMRQQKAKINNVLVDEQLDNMYMEAIQMKLKMLGDEEN